MPLTPDPRWVQDRDGDTILNTFDYPLGRAELASPRGFEPLLPP